MNQNGSSRKVWLLTTTLVIPFPFSLPSLKKREKEKENELAKIVIKSLDFLLDHRNAIPTVIWKDEAGLYWCYGAGVAH